MPYYHEYKGTQKPEKAHNPRHLASQWHKYSVLLLSTGYETNSWSVGPWYCTEIVIVFGTMLGILWRHSCGRSGMSY